MKTIADRLKEAREELGLTQPELAARAGVSAGTIGNVEAGIRKRPRDLLAIADALGVQPAWLQSNKGPKHRSELLSDPPHLSGKTSSVSRIESALSAYSKTDEDGHSTTLLPVVGFQGLKMSQKNGGMKDTVSQWLTVPGLMSELAKITKMPDDSMQPEIYQGEFVAFEPDIEADAGDTVLLADKYGGLWIRKYRPMPGGQFDAAALNPEHATLQSRQHGLKVLAVLVGHWRGRRAKRH